MKPGSRVERFARKLDPLKRAAVRSASVAKTESRNQTLRAVFGDGLDRARAAAAETKDDTLRNLKALLLRFEERCVANGIQVHWAESAESAVGKIVGLVSQCCPKAGFVVKGKSMATEEIHLNPALERAGFRPVETDLGEFVVQIDGDTPSHIVTPIIHKTRQEVARSFAREGLGPYTEQPEELTLQARTYLREIFREAKVGISGVNFGIAESGRLVIVENEGNNRLSTTVPKVHIAVMGIEKLLPRERDLPLFLRLLSGSGTGQRLTTYVHMISGPRRPDEADGPEEVHLVLLDNGRSRLLRSGDAALLRCIRCGACLNVCPVYRQASGHAYGHVYSGPIGAVLAPLLSGNAYGDLPFASSLCGACEEVCPVRIPIPSALLRLRNAQEAGGGSLGAPLWRGFAWIASRPGLWRAAMGMSDFAWLIPHPALRSWRSSRELPSRVGRDFRRWWRERP